MLKKKILGLSIVLFIALSIFYCGGGGNGTPDIPETEISDPSFSTDIQPIFTSNCALSGCHNSTAQEGLILLQGQAYTNIVNVDSTQDTQRPVRKIVLPADAANSYLVIKIEGNQTVGDRMPQGRSALSSVRINNIKNWVNRGAKNN
jgi:hypothetical protein